MTNDVGITTRGDLIPLDALGSLAWDAGSAEASLATVAGRATDTAQSAITWYLSAKRPKQMWARGLRTASILLAALAGLLPMLAQLGAAEGAPKIQPVWASVALGLAAAAIMLDRFFGFSTAWLRYVSTELHLRQMLDDFQLDWEADRAARKGAQPTEEQVQRALAKCRTFISQVNGLVREETSLWVTEFQESLKQLDETVKARAVASQPAALNIGVTNGDQFSEWTVTVDGGPPRGGSGKSGAVTAVSPGLHTIRVEGTRNGKRSVAEKAIATAPGAITDVELTLS